MSAERSSQAATFREILVVDDERDLCQLLKQALEKAGYSVTCVYNGRQAVQQLMMHGPFDLVITDILMPERDGLELIVELRRHYPGTKILAISGGGRIGPSLYLKEAKELGANALLEKPFTAQQLLLAIEELATGAASGPGS